MPLTSAQLTSLKAHIDSVPELAAYPNNSDGAFAIAAILNAVASPAFIVWQSAVTVDAITDAIDWAKMTPAAAPDGTQLWANRALQCQGKQFNLQNLLLGRSVVAANKANIRAAFQDCLTQLPSKADGTNQPAGWTAIQTAMQRSATSAEKIFATGTGTAQSPATMGWEGELSYQDVETARATN